jgi:hypothetical protein
VYFESGFPYEKDQWISISATSWATAALALTVQNPSKDADPKKPPDDSKRRAPTILAPSEGAGAVALTQVSSHIIEKRGKRELIMVLGEAPNAPEKEREVRFVPLEELGKNNNFALARTVRPLRQAIIVGSFPYKEQVEEFQRKLGLKKVEDVLTDVSGKTAEGEKTPLPAFRFLGVDLERRRVNAEGKPLTGRDGKPLPWEEVNPSESYRPYVWQNGKRFEPDAAALEKISFAGLVMPRLALMRSGQYPPVERRLATLQKTLDRLKADATALPGHCLIRLIDVDVLPGDIYRYRFRVRMANPNYKRTDVASPELAERNTPLLSAWFEIPQLVAVPPEYHVYAVDQSELDKKYEGQNKDVRYDPNRQAAFQIHKWLGHASPDGRTDFPVGEWSVAERVIVSRGEFVGPRQRVEVPYWSTARERFVLAGDKSIQGEKTKGILVDFNPPDGDPMILVDFEGGQLSYTRAAANDDKAERVRVTEKAGSEALILSPDGKLLSRTSWTDSNDKERVERLDTWRRRIKEVKEGTSTGDPKNPFDNP